MCNDEIIWKVDILFHFGKKTATEDTAYIIKKEPITELIL